MSAIHQMGNDSENLVAEVDGFSGLIASPVNYTPEAVAGQVQRFQTGTFDAILDPQLYFPRSERGQLRTWSHFPEEIDTADLGSEGWWRTLGQRAVAAARAVGARGVCSPSAVSSVANNAYYRMMANVAGSMSGAAAPDLRVLQTVLVRLADLTTDSRAMEIASIASGASVREAYVVFLSDVQPRIEYSNTDELRGAMKLIRALSDAGVRVTVGFCGSEVLLWKAAGAAACATGKFFNLRRFTPGRFEDPSGGGGQVAYWFEEGNLAFLRETDLIRFRDRGLLSQVSLSNPHGVEILERLTAEPGRAWVGLGWRQYMHWFADVQSRIESGMDVDGLLVSAENMWQTLQDQTPRLLMEEVRNDGRWIRPWRRALAEYNYVPPPSTV